VKLNTGNNSCRYISEGAAVSSIYPESTADRDRWILAMRPLARRPDQSVPNPREPYAFLLEEEPSADGEILPVVTIFLTNRECPFRCVMCDLWQNTLPESVPRGAIPAQIDFALGHLPRAGVVKLYNGGSFFDSRAIPTEDHGEIALRIRDFERVIVECHPAFVNERCVEFHGLLCGQRLEMAMGLETANPRVLEKLNKRMTLEQFAVAANFLRANLIDLRVFILVQPPFMKPEESLYWAQRSLDFAFDCGATAATLIPTRAGNGAMEALASDGDFVAPGLGLLEAATTYGLEQKRGRVFADLWDIGRGSECISCFVARVGRLRRMNLRQELCEPVTCNQCRKHK
jgi:archaeosine synthase beta-subunit